MDAHTNADIVVFFVATWALATVKGSAESVVFGWTQVCADDRRHARVVFATVEVFTAERTWQHSVTQCLFILNIRLTALFYPNIIHVFRVYEDEKG